MPKPSCLNIGAYFLIVMGLTVCFGWYNQIDSLIQIHPDFVPMQFNTALGFVFLGLSIFGINYEYYFAARCFASLVFLLGFLTLIQYILSFNIGIDQLFIEHYITVATSHPGRMAPNTALCFLLSSLSLWFLTYFPPRIKFLSTASILSAFVTGFGTVAFFGYLSEVETAYGWGMLTQMAIHTSVGFVVAGFSLIVDSQCISLRRFQRLPFLMLPITSGIVGLTITISFWQSLEASESMIRAECVNYRHNLISEGILIMGVIFSIVLGATIWLTQKYREQVMKLKQAQYQILQLNSQLEKISYLDALTGVANRRLFDMKLSQEWKKAYNNQSYLGLIMLDIDYFKNYNDYYGHRKGDECLKQVAEAICEVVRSENDLVARYGGEEFVIILPNTDKQSLDAIALRTLNSIRQRSILHENSPISKRITASLGGYTIIPESVDLSELENFMDKADQALYEAKSKGRNCIVIR
ncbi:diguanylate cyclase [Cyanobacterium aponinum UTEX 3221]|uniref:diguanylate cyclase n=1 Tax=Cyanobacterium aponinum TaxID=379064 RepID=UPI002B4BA9DE|nr:diguanylate cyclase [Cyanobacterium aponinum]WRL39232.1 diguanylate cyclase [Cyanobacterium aponinum UTEX 3221]